MTDQHNQGDASAGAGRLPAGVVARLSCYLHILVQSDKAGRSFISSRALSEHARVNPTQIRRDLAAFGSYGKRGVGYEVEPLIAALRQIIGVPANHEVALLGAGRLGGAIAQCDIFREHGFLIAAVFDKDPAKIGSQVGKLVVQPVSEVVTTIQERGIEAGVIAVPGPAAQEAADSLYSAGVRIVINYSGGLVKAPPSAVVHDINPAAGLLQSLHVREVNRDKKSAPGGAL